MVKTSWKHSPTLTFIPFILILTPQFSIISYFFQGVIDFAKEKVKTEKNMKDLENKLKALEKKMSNKDYKAKVPQNVQDQDAEKCESLKIEIQESKKAIESITSLL